MKASGYNKTKLEVALHVWTAINVATGIWLILTSDLVVFGSGFQVYAPVAISILAAAILLWRLFYPSRWVLLFGTLFWALQIVSVRYPDALYALRLGLAVNFRVTDDPNFIVLINLLALIVTILFAIATRRRATNGLGSSAT